MHDIDLEPAEEVIINDYLPELGGDCDIRGLYNNNRTLGGILKIKHDAFFGANGFPNNFWGWGFEDNDLQNRVNFKGYITNRTHVVSLCNNYAGHDDEVHNSKFTNYDKINKQIIMEDVAGCHCIKKDFVDRYFHNLEASEKAKYIDNNGITTLKYEMVSIQRNAENIKLYVVKI